MELPPQPAGYRRYAITILLIVFILNHLDRQVINILAEPIKIELGLADWQIGLLTGLSFAMLYTVVGIPIAHFSEKTNRVRIIAAAVTVWSFFTFLSGSAQSFLHLVLFRVGVGVGEAGCTPPAQSLIVDYTPKEKRASTLAFYHMGVPLGGLLGLAMGGLVLDAYGWRAAFLVAGAPGLLFGLVVLLTLREPRKQHAALWMSSKPEQAKFSETMRMLFSKKTFWYLSLASAFKAFIGYGHAPFTASFFFRVHGDELSRISARFGLESAGFLGVALGLSSGLAGVLGAWIGGQMADRAARRGDVRAYPTIPALAALATIPFYVIAILADTAVLALILLVVPAILGNMWYGPVHTTQQGLVPPHMRATATAVLLFVLNLIGLGLGPLCVGVMSDVLSGPVGLGPAEGVRWALILSSLIGLVTFSLFWAARKTVQEDMIL